MVGVLGLGLGWLSHFSPMTDQPVSVIYHGYTAPWEGVVAAGLLFLLMFSVLSGAVLAAYLWRRGDGL